MMNKITLLITICLLELTSFAQTQTFDITNFITPINWEKNVKEGSSISFTTSNRQKNSYCRITVYKSIVSKGDINKDYESEWAEIVAKNYTLSNSVKTSAIQKAGDWSTKTGIASFTYNNSENTVILSTTSGFEKATSILIIYNNPEYDSTIKRFLSNVNYKITTSSTAIPVEKSNNPLPLVGKWARSVSVSYNVGGVNSGYVRSIYDFKSNNTYTFTQRTWKLGAKYIFIVKETGILKISNSQLTLIAQSSTIESWDKQNNNDVLGKLIATNKRPLESIAYQFVFSYDNSMKDWNLVLQANKETLRDGKFAGVQPYPNGWYYTKRFSDYDLTAPKIE